MRRLFLKFFRRGRLHSDLEAELAHHRELSLSHGNPIGLGNTTLIRENALDLWRLTFIEDLLRDIAYAVRQMRRNRAFAVTAVLSLALGIGLITSIFSLLNAVTLRPLPYSDPDRLVWMTQILKWNGNGTDEITITPDFLEWRRQNHAFTDLAGYNYVTRNLTGLAEPVEVQPFLGRNFLKQEDYKGHDQVAILAYEMWQSKFGGDRHVIGRPITLDSQQFTIIGVLPRDFVFPGSNPVQIITPLAKDENAELHHNPNGPVTLVQNVIGRLRRGVTREQAIADLTVIQSNLPQMAFHPTITIKMLPLREHLFGSAKTASFLLIDAAGFLLLIASANVSNLLLVRLMQRDRELAIRTVMGGSRRRIVSQLLTEGALLGVFGCGIGLLLAFWIRRPLFTLSPYRLAGFENLPFDGRVLLFAIALSFVTTLLFALMPAFRATEIRVAEAMKAGQASIAGGRGSLRLLSLITAAEIATIFVLSTGAGLMLESFWRMRYTNLGFQPDRLIAATLQLSGLHYRQRPRQLAFIHELLSQAQALPGVESAAITNAREIPPGEWHATNTFRIEGRPLPVDSRHKPIARQEDVSAGYFGIMQIPLLEGRFFSDSDREGTTPVAVVNRELERRFFHGENPLGHRVRVGGPWCEVVGIVGNVKTSGLAAAPEPTLYFPFAQRDRPTEGALDIGVIMRSALGTATIAAEFREAVHKVDPNQPVATVQSMNYRLSESVSKPRFTAVLLSTFASLAVVLGLIGVYGVMGCRVRSQLRELAVRQALGAQPKEVVTHVLRQGLRIVLPGLCIGLFGSLVMSRLLASMLYDTKPNDPLTLLGVAVSVISAALLACLIPAARAARIDPLRTLRQN